MNSRLVTLAKYDWKTSRGIDQDTWTLAGLINKIVDVIDDRFYSDVQNFYFSDVISLHEIFRNEVINFNMIRGYSKL